MSLVSSGKCLYGRDIPAQKYGQLTNVSNWLELYNLAKTNNGNGGWVSFTWIYSFIFNIVSEVVYNGLGDG